MPFYVRALSPNLMYPVNTRIPFPCMYEILHGLYSGIHIRDGLEFRNGGLAAAVDGGIYAFVRKIRFSDPFDRIGKIGVAGTVIVVSEEFPVFGGFDMLKAVA